MTLHPSVVAYGQRRGYSNVTDFNNLLFHNSHSRSAHSTDSSSSNYAQPTDIMVNLSEPSIYLNELSLFSAYFNSLPSDNRQLLRKYVDELVSFFISKLSRYGHAPDILSPVVALFNFPPVPDSSASNADEEETTAAQLLKSNADQVKTTAAQLLKHFLFKFQVPLIREYFVSETDLLSLSEEPQDVGTGPNGQVDPPSEDEDDFTPDWWKNGVQTNQKEDAEPNQNDDIESPKITNDLHSVLQEIQGAYSNLERCKISNPDPSSFPYPVKIYNISSGNGRVASKPVCAAVTSQIDFGCFGCAGDSSVHCFSLRRSEDSFTLRTASASGVIYRIGLLEDTDKTFLLATSNEPSCCVTLFDLASKESLCGYGGHRWPVWALDVEKRGGGMFVTGSYDQTARFFLLERRDPVRVFVGHEGSVDCVQFMDINGKSKSSDHDYAPYLCTASSDRTVRIWSLADAVPVRMFHGMKGSPTALAVRRSSPNGTGPQLIACATTEAKIFLWDVDSGKLYQILEDVVANDLEFSPDGHFLISGGDHGCLKIYRWSKEGEQSGQYVDVQLSPNVISHIKESKLLKVRLAEDEMVCLTASV